MSEQRRIYLDNSATTKICDRALNKYIEVSKENFGNPSSLHGYGFSAEKELNEARAAVLRSVGERDAAVVFTASGSEANNLAIIGRALAKERYKKGSKIITTRGEHASVEEPMLRLAEMGFVIVEIPTVGGKINMEAFARELTPNVVLVSVMMVNNETGALYDVAKVSALTHEKCPEAAVHVDATQSYMKVRFTKRSLGADMITLSSHKIEGPKGVGALVIDKEIIKNKGLSPIIFGGGQEGGLRSGTENVPAVAAFGEAIKYCSENLSSRIEKMRSLREALIEGITSDELLKSISITLPDAHAPHILNITLPSIRSETALHYLSSLGIYVSSGSACSSNSSHASSALISYGRTPEEADSSIRISFSPDNTTDDVQALLDGLRGALTKLARKR